MRISTASAIKWSMFLPVSIAVSLAAATMVFDLRLANESSDIHNYIRHALRFEDFPPHYFEGLITFLSREVIFHYLMLEATIYFGDAEYVLRTMTFLAALVFFLLSAKGSTLRDLFALFILFHPRVLDLLASQQRFAIATSLLLISLRFESRLVRYGILFICSGVHLHFLLVLAFLIFVDVILLLWDSRSAKYYGPFGFLLVVAVIVAFLTTIGREQVLAFIGDSRAETGRDSGTGALYTLMMTFTFLTYFAFVFRRKFESVSFLLVLSILQYFFASTVDLFSSRYVAFALVLLAFSFPDRILQRHLPFVFVFMVNFGMSYYYWL